MAALMVGREQEEAGQECLRRHSSVLTLGGNQGTEKPTDPPHACSRSQTDIKNSPVEHWDSDLIGER